MNFLNTIKVGIVTISTVMIIGCGSTSGSQIPQTSPDGLELKKDAQSTIVYKKSNVDFNEYNQVIIAKSTVAFRKNWQKDYNQDQISSSTRIRDKDVIRIKDNFAKLFDETFTKEFNSSDSYSVVDVSKANNKTLVFKPSIINLDIRAPDVKSVSGTKNFVESSGQATLFLEVYDAVSGEILARIINTQVARSNGMFQWATSASNKADAKKMIKKWATTLRKNYEQARIEK